MRRTLARAGRGGRRLVGFQEIGVLVSLLVLVGVIGAFNPGFLSRVSVTTVGNQAALYGIMALGMVFLLSMREIDISVGSAYAVTILAAGQLMKSGLDPWLGGLACILIGALLGAFNGVATNLLRIPSIIVTLGTLSMYRGVGLIVSNGATVAGLPDQHPFFTKLGSSVLGLPAVVWAMLGLTVVLSVVYKRTRFGIVVRAIGANEEAARLGGISVERHRLYALTLMGALAGISGMLTLAYFGSADPTIGTGYELQVIAAAVIGGTALQGGSGTVIGALLGALIIAVIQSGLIQFGVGANWSIFATGAVIICAVAVDAVVKRQRARRLEAQA
jgi:ribose transport system permease protein